MVKKIFKVSKSKHERAIELLEQAEMLRWRVDNWMGDAEGWIGDNFPELRRKYLHKSEICEMAYQRVMERYINLLVEIEEELEVKLNEKSKV